MNFEEELFTGPPQLAELAQPAPAAFNQKTAQVEPPDLTIVLL
ncbi:hypothetical protein [Gemmata obscuriglobus]|nr:hypothetical protein [Gemmata obscuriglobus]